MIKVNENEVYLKGDKSTILTEFSMLVRTLRKTETISAEDIEFNFQSAFIDDTGEIKRLAIQRLMKKMGGLFGKDE